MGLMGYGYVLGENVRTNNVPCRTGEIVQSPVGIASHNNLCQLSKADASSIGRLNMARNTTEFKCDICGATFRDRDALTKHLRVHEQTENMSQELEQGTQPPMENPTLPPITPQPIRAGPGT
jgi:hypothetical protein